MKKTLSLLVTAAVLCVGAAAAETQGAPGLDPGFGDRGKVELPGQIEETRETVQLPDGRVVIASRDEMVALLPSGEIDPGFGAAGVAPLVLPSGAAQGTIVDLAVDSRGRLIVVGTCSFPATTEDGRSAYRQEILTERLNADGSLDFGFGDSGFATSDFGAPPPEPSGPSTVLARYAALDASDRILISAQKLAGKQFHKGYFYGRYEAFVARLDAEGAVDTSFANEGVLPLPSAETLGMPIVDARGGFFLQAFFRPATLIHLGPGGEPDPSFGESGGRPLPEGVGGPVLLDDSGRLILYGDLQGSKADRLANGILIKRLLPDGSLDRSFGHGGAVVFRMPRLYTARITLDEQGRILVGAALKKQARRGRRPALPTEMAVARLRPGGSLDASFGRHGVVRAPLPGRSEINVESFSARDGTALLGGGGCSKSSCNRTLIRVRLGPR